MKAVLILSIVVALLLCGCRRSDQPGLIPKETAAKPPASNLPPQADPDGQLLCLVETAEEAEEIAVLYGIRLVSHYDGIAKYHTEENPQEVIRRGEENGWPELSLNYLLELY